ncbi:hypothetical protein CDCA_CDCA15G4015 [Cyanidium caldarium]|uniref:Uncharacterized protein n=1 Tax=Cyanidium caldarium TaxID=2771 RepID=A0AAV9J0Y9_CYACA|nr:hypothetical protein CDCA_CDCA15G4015 [Cyanidium caldarium]
MHASADAPPASVRRFARSAPVSHVVQHMTRPGVGAVVTWLRGDGEERYAVASGHRAEAFAVAEKTASEEDDRLGTPLLHSGTPFVKLVHGALDLSTYDAFTSAQVTFTGIARADRMPDGTTVQALEYEAYADMAAPMLQALARRHRAAAVVHSGAGVVPAGSASVHIAAPTVLTTHRIIDQLKQTVPIWKQDVVVASAQNGTADVLPAVNHRSAAVSMPPTTSTTPHHTR